jgi:hypothetical protein
MAQSEAGVDFCALWWHRCHHGGEEGKVNSVEYCSVLPVKVTDGAATAHDSERRDTHPNAEPREGLAESSKPMGP